MGGGPAFSFAMKFGLEFVSSRSKGPTSTSNHDTMPMAVTEDPENLRIEAAFFHLLLRASLKSRLRRTRSINSSILE